jgi:RNA polymerase sigma factor (sigma-70 family)
MEERTDASLVAMARCGDKLAFGELIERYQAMAQILTMRLVGNVDIAREMAQEAMLQAYLSLDHLRVDTRFKGWFYGIVLNVCRNYLREQKRPALSLEATLTGLGSSENYLLSALPDPQEELEERELRQLMREAVNLLLPKNRTVNFLFYYEQLSLQEIAGKLGISIVAVKSRLHQARKELRAWFITAYPEMQHAVAPERKRKTLIPVTVVEVVQQDRSSVLVLWDKAGKRALPVWVGYWEGEAIASSLQSNAAPSILTFNFMANLLKASRSEVVEVRLESLKEDTLYAVTRVRHGNTVQEVEARPSDALALAVHSKSAVYVAEDVMERAGVDLPAENEKAAQQDLDKIVSKLKDRPTGLTTMGSTYPKQPRNLDFKQGTTGWFLSGSRPLDYEEGIDHNVKPSGESSAYLKSKLSATGGFGILMQMFDADDYRGKRVQLLGYVKSESVEPWAGLLMRVDGPNGYLLSFDNMENRPIVGTSDWQQYAVVLDVPENAAQIAFGILLAGKGQIWLSNGEFAIVGGNIPTTGEQQLTNLHS